MTWQLIDLHRIHECRAHWQHAVAVARAFHPLLSGNFLFDAIQRLGERGRKRYMLVNATEGGDAAMILEPVRLGAWRTSAIAQLPLAPIMISPTHVKPFLSRNVFRGLPGLPWTITIKDHDAKYSSSTLLEHKDVIEIFQTHVTVCIDIHRTFEEYWSSRSSSLRRSIRSSIRKVQGEGLMIGMSVVTSPEHIEAAIKVHGELEETGWKSTAGTPLSIGTDEACFYRDALIRAAGTTNARVYQLRLGKEIVASQLVLIEGTTMALVKTAYHARFARFAPGRLLDYFMLQSLFEEDRIKRVEYCTIASDDDVRWSTSVRPITEIHLYRWPILRTAVRTLRAIKRPLHKPVPRWRDGFGTSMKRLRSHLAQSGLTGIARGLLRRFERAIARWRDEALDRKYDIDTRGIVEAYATDHIGEHGEHSTGHEPIQRLLFARMLKLLPGDLRQFTFVDFGSGKGRAVILAAHWPFARVVGVEFSPALHSAAQRNVAIFRSRGRPSAFIELQCEDAARSSIPTGPLVCFFYNPFGPVVMRKVLENIERSLKSNPRPLLLLYRNPVCADLFGECAWLERTYANPDFHIYAARA